MIKRIKIFIFVMVLVFAGANLSFAFNESYLDTIYQSLQEDAGEALSPETLTGDVVIDLDDPDLDVTIEVNDNRPDGEDGDEEDEGEMDETDIAEGDDNTNDEDADDADVDEDDEDEEEELTPEELKINGILNDLTRILAGQFGGIIPDFKIISLTGSNDDGDDNDGDDNDGDDNDGDDNDGDDNDGDDNDGDDNDGDDNDGDDNDGDDNDGDDNDGDDNDGDDNDGDDNDGDDNDGDDNEGDDNDGDDNDGDDNDGDDNDGDDNEGKEPEDPNSVEGLKAHILDEYDIVTSDGTSEWSLKQLEILSDTLKTLPAAFIECTEQITRDENDPEKESLLGYVKFLELEVHVLDRATSLSPERQAYIREQLEDDYREWFIKNYETLYNRKPTEEEVEKEVENYINGIIEKHAVRDLKHTYIHEMTHCLQHYHTDIYREWQDTFWPNKEIKGESCSNYGNSLPYEDMAECFAYFLIGEGELEDDGYKTYDGGKIDSERYEFVKRVMNELGGNY